MGIWYRAGTAAVSNGSPNVTGTGTTWNVYVRPGDRITFDGGGKWYEILAIPSNTSITLATNFEEATIAAPGGAYAIDPSSYRHQIPSDILEQVRQVLAGQTDVFLTTGAPSDELGDEQSIAFDPAAKVLYVKGATVWGAAVPFGDVGPTGPRGQPGGLIYLFDTGTANADPGAGKVRANNAALASATALYISETDGLGVNVSAFLATLDDSTNTVRGMLTLASVATPANFRIYSVSGTLTDGGTFNALTIAHVAGNGTFANNEELAVQFAPAGNVGATGATGAPGGESVLMTFATATADADPGAGLVRLNNATLASVTQAFIDETTPAAVNIAAWLDTWDDSTNPTNKAVVTFSRANSPAANFARYYLTAVVSATGYRKLNLTHILSAGSLDTTASNLLIGVERVGNQGLAGGLTDGDKGDITVTIGGTVFTIDNDVVSNAKLANMAAETIKGNFSGSAGDPTDLNRSQASRILFLNPGDENRIINGAFDHWQRGTSFSNAGPAADRWRNEFIGGTVSLSRNAFAMGDLQGINNPRFYLSQSVSGQTLESHYALIQHRIEDVRTYAGQTITILGFIRRVSGAGNVAVDLAQNFGTGGSPSASVGGIGVTQISLTSSFAPFAVNIAVPSVAGKVLGSNNNDFLSLAFWTSAGSNWNARTGSLGLQTLQVDLCGVHIRPGTWTTDAINSYFLPSPIDELDRCLRYYQTVGADDNLGMSNSTTSAYMQANFPAVMRAIPTLALVGGGASITVNFFGIGSSTSSSFVLGATQKGLTINVNTLSPARTAGVPTNSLTAITADAEI